MKTFKCGYSGGFGGSEFSDDALPADGKIVEVLVYHGVRVSAVQIAYETAGGSRHDMALHGSKRGEPARVLLDADEYIKEVSGRYDERVNLLQITTNKQRFAAFGSIDRGPSFIYQSPPGMEIAGFFGRCGLEIDAVGVILRTLPKPAKRETSLRPQRAKKRPV